MRKRKLFPIPLLGQGTAEIESLASYIFRCSYEHGVSVGVLLKLIHERCPDHNQKFRKNVAGKTGLKILSRMSGYTESMRGALSVLTGQDLKCEALTFLDNQIQGIGKEMCEFRWCPQCLKEMENNGTLLYFKQIWHMKAITYCPLHRTPLITECPHCCSEQFSFRSNYQIGLCLNCGEKLSDRKQALEPVDISDAWDCLSLDLYEVFQKQSISGFSYGDFCSAKNFIEEVYFSQQMKRNYLRTEQTQILHHLLFNLLRDWRNKHSLLMLRRVAYYMNLSLCELLSCTKDKAHQIPLDLNNESEIPEAFKVQKRPYHNHKEEHQKIVYILKTKKKPPSLKGLARLADISVGYLEYRYPELMNKVVREHQEYKTHLAQAKKHRAQEAAKRFFSNDQYAHMSQTKYEAYKVLSQEENLPKWILIRAINEAYDELVTESPLD